MKQNLTSVIADDPFTPTSETLWESAWQLRIALTQCERDLLNTWSLRRLGFVRAFGVGGLVLPTQHSRLAHVRGVFALAAHFHPGDELLRLAALLHDVGHGPFSHSAETLPGFDHHTVGQSLILNGEVGDILRRYNFDPRTVMALTEANPPNPIRTQNSLLHLDHLDFFVRDPFVCGWHSPLPAEILSRLYLNGPNVATDLVMAEHLVERIVFENRLFVAPAKIAAEAVMSHLLKYAGEKKIINPDPQHVVGLTDADILAYLSRAGDAHIDHWLDRLWRRPHTLSVRRVETDKAVPAEALMIRIDTPYLNQPLVEGQPVAQVSAKAAAMLAEADTFWGTFVVEMSD